MERIKIVVGYCNPESRSKGAGLEKQIKIEGRDGGRRRVPRVEVFITAKGVGFDYDRLLMCMTAAHC